MTRPARSLELSTPVSTTATVTPEPSGEFASSPSVCRAVDAGPVSVSFAWRPVTCIGWSAVTVQPVSCEPLGRLADTPLISGRSAVTVPPAALTAAAGLLQSKTTTEPLGVLTGADAWAEAPPATPRVTAVIASVVAAATTRPGRALARLPLRAVLRECTVEGAPDDGDGVCVISASRWRWSSCASSPEHRPVHGHLDQSQAGCVAPYGAPPLRPPATYRPSRSVTGVRARYLS